MAEGEKQADTSVEKPKKFELKIDPKKDAQGNPIVSNEGPMISGDSTWKKRLEMMQEED